HRLDETGINPLMALESGAPAGVAEIGPVRDASDSFLVEAPLPQGNDGPENALYMFPKISWDSWWSVHQGEFDEAQVAPVAAENAVRATASTPAATAGLSCTPGDTWSNGSLDALPEPRSNHVAVWTGNVMVIWGGSPPGGLLTNVTN